MFVRVLDRARDLGKDANQLWRGEEALAQPVGKRPAAHEPHGIECAVVVFAGLVQRDDVRVVEPGCGLDLHAEPHPRRRRPEQPGIDHLERDRPVEAQLPGHIDDPHAAPGDLAHERVVAKEPRVPGGRRGEAGHLRPGLVFRKTGQRVVRRGGEGEDAGRAQASRAGARDPGAAIRTDRFSASVRRGGGGRFVHCRWCFVGPAQI